MTIRKAKKDEHGLLSSLAFRSKAYWGYDDSFMEKARADLTVSPEYISLNDVCVAEQNGGIVGFFSLLAGGKRRGSFIAKWAPSARGSTVLPSLRTVSCPYCGRTWLNDGF